MASISKDNEMFTVGFLASTCKITPQAMRRWLRDHEIECDVWIYSDDEDRWVTGAFRHETVARILKMRRDLGLSPAARS